MESKVVIGSNMLLWTLFLLSSFAPLSQGGADKDLFKSMKHPIYHKDEVMMTFKIDGVVIDCFDVNKQPGFKHHLLINHKLQMKPTYYPKKLKVHDHLMEAYHPLNLSKRCPEGSIPIERVQKNGHIRDNHPKRRWYKDQHNFRWQGGVQNSKDDTYKHEHSIVAVHGEKYYGAKASINVWNPTVENTKEYTVSQIWVTNEDGTTSLEAGWTVFPHLYGGNATRFFAFWTPDNYKTACYNFGCPGFIQTNDHVTISSYLRPVSVYGGPQYSIEVEIFKDMKTGNWWLLVQGVEIGYWAREVVPALADGAGVIEWGGEVVSSGGHTSTQMGSGHYSDEGFKKSSFFKNIQVLDTSNKYKDPTSYVVVIQSPKCYDLKVGGVKDGPWGYFFFYGGPGRSEKCT